MPTPAFFRDLTAVFNNSKLSDKRKYDITCRLLCESLQVATASLILYDSKSDKLVCKGNYLAPQTRSNYVVNNNVELREIIENQRVFEYFDSNIYESNDDFNYEKFKEFDGESNIDTVINEFKFNDLKSKWITTRLSDSFREFKELIHSEAYAVDKSTISGNYYLKLLANGNKISTGIEVVKMENGPQRGNRFFEVWEKVRANISRRELYYVGLPLFASERYTGILRLSTYRNPASTIDDIFSLQEKKAGTVDINDEEFESVKNRAAKQVERLNQFAQLVSLHCKTEFYLAGYRILNNLKIDTNNNQIIESSELNTVCNILSKVINCYGCLIRYDEYEGSKSPSIKGISDNLRKYSEYAMNHPSPNFSEDIAEIFKSQKHNNYKVRAINFTIAKNYEDNIFFTNEYYYEQESDFYEHEFENETRLRFEKNVQRKFSDFTPDYNRKLYELKMREIVVLPLDFTKNGYIILTNTENRKFTSSDIEMLLLASKRIGLEIKYFQDREEIKEKNKSTAREENSRVIVHQIYAPIVTMGMHLDNLVNKKVHPDEVEEKLGKALHNYHHALRHLNTVQKYLEWETKGINVKKNPIKLTETLIARAIQFRYLADTNKNLRIRVFPEDEDYNYIIDSDRNLLIEVLNCLLDNAIKYSFSRSKMIKHGIPIDYLDPRSEGHIHIGLSANEQKTIITVTNTGCVIPEDEKDVIFIKGKRGRNAKFFSEVGQGIGLYMVKRILTALKGTVDVIPQPNYKTTFKITLPND